MTRKSKLAAKLLFVLLFCAALSVAGCGRKQEAPLSEGGENSAGPPGAKPVELPIEQQIEQKLDPLTKDDVDLYLKVMRAAAERVKNPAPADQSTLDGAKKILAAGATGRVPSPDDVKTLERANLVAISMDQIVAEEMKLDGRTYRGIVEAVESVVPDLAIAVASTHGGTPVPAHTPTTLEKRLSDVNVANQKFLMPYREEIQKLIAIVRNPANLPK